MRKVFETRHTTRTENDLFELPSFFFLPGSGQLPKLTVAFFGNEKSREDAQAFMGLFEGPRTLNCIVILVAV